MRNQRPSKALAIAQLLSALGSVLIWLVVFVVCMAIAVSYFTS
jgi:uncharacterized membrane-anchored protein